MHVLVPSNVTGMAARGATHEVVEGAALIVDSEGSTALASRLEPYASAGAEALLFVLADVFGPIVDNVDKEGGVVAAFAGDGVLAVFPGEPGESVARAVRAARDILSRLGGAKAVDTPVGPSKLTVRCIVGAGTIEWLIWATADVDMSQNAAYACVGSALEEAQAGERIVRGGQLAIGPTARRHVLSDIAVSSTESGFAFVDHTWSPPAVFPRPKRAVPVATHLSFFPADLAGEDLRGEFRNVVSVFVEFETRPGFGPDSSMVRLLHALAEHRGYLCNVLKSSSDRDSVRVLALWGAPTSREQDVEYAIRFLESLRTSAGVGAMRAGVTTSVAFAGFVGNSTQESYTAVGFGVSLAARMCAAADWGEIRVGEGVATALHSPWILEPLGSIDYRGVDELTLSYRVGYVPPIRQYDMFQGPFVDRHVELGQLEDLLRPLWTGQPAGVIAVTGEPGIGKSRIVTELQKRLSALDPAPTWLDAQADEIRAQPFSTLRDALSGYFGKQGTSESSARLASFISELKQLAPWLAHELDRDRAALGDLLDLPDDVTAGESLDPKTRFDNLRIAVRDLVVASEVSSPVIIHVSDGQWIDAGTAEILDQVRGNVEGLRVAMIVETRTPEMGIQPNHRVDLAPLAESDSRVLANELAGGNASLELVSTVARRADGNPYFIEQLVEYVKRETQADSRHGEPDLGDASGDDLPTDLRRALVARLDDLPLDVKRAVQVGAVLGREVDLAVLAEMASGMQRLGDQVRHAVDAGVWREIDATRVAFTNTLVRDAAQGMLLHSDLRNLHESAALAIESLRGHGESHAAELAYHFDRAGHAGVAAEHYVRAGRAEARRSSSEEALAYLERALNLFDPKEVKKRFEALQVIHDVYDVLGDRTAQERTIRAMDGLVSEPGPEAIDVAVRRSRLLVALGRYPEAESEIRQAYEMVDRGPPDARGQLTFIRAQLARYGGRTDEAKRLASEARQVFDKAGEVTMTATVDDFLGGIAWDIGDFEDAVTLHRSAAEVFRDHSLVTDEIRALNNLGSALFAIGDYSTARKIHEEGAERSRAIGYRMGEGDHLDNIGGTDWAIGAYQSAIEHYEASLEIRDGMEDAWGVAISKGNLGATTRAMGNPDGGLRLYREALKIDQQIGRRRGEAYDLHGIGLCHLDEERFDLAVEALRRAAEIRTELGEDHLAHESKVACAVAMLRRGDLADAKTLVEEALGAEGDRFFDRAVETTATRIRSVEVVESFDPDRAAALEKRARSDVLRRAGRIADPADRRSYLENIVVHRLRSAG